MGKDTKKKDLQKSKYEVNGYNLTKWIFSAIIALYIFIIWILVWINDVTMPMSALIFSVIPLCFVVSHLNRNKLFILLAEFFTIGADIFLILLGSKYTIPGVCFFVVVQTFYMVYILLEDKNKTRKIVTSVIRAALVIILVPSTWAVVKNNTDTTGLVTAMITMVYFPNLVMNIICFGMLKKWYLMIAFILFMLCDICVGLNVILPSTNPFMKVLNVLNFTHIFYIPSQFMIAFSSHWYMCRKKYFLYNKKVK